MQRQARNILSVVLVIIAAALFSCSFQASFIIKNLSDGMMEVTYEFRNAEGVEFSCPDGSVSIAPAVSLASDTDSRDSEWTPLMPGEYVCDPVARTVFIPVGSGVALRVVRHDDPGSEIGTYDAKRFPVGRLLINGTAGSMEFSGEQVLRAFERGDVGLTFYLDYK